MTLTTTQCQQLIARYKLVESAALIALLQYVYEQGTCRDLIHLHYKEEVVK